MTREESIKMLRGMKADNLNLDDLYTKDKYEALDMAIKALEQERYYKDLIQSYEKTIVKLTEAIAEQQPSDDKVTITMNKGTLKYSNREYVIYNKDWFRKHFATEVEIITGYDGYIKQPTSEDCVSRQVVTDAVENTIAKYIPIFIGRYEKIPLELALAIKDVPPVTPTRKVGKWIVEVWNNKEHHTCSNCQHLIDYEPCYHYCPMCGAEMEREE